MGTIFNDCFQLAAITSVYVCMQTCLLLAQVHATCGIKPVVVDAQSPYACSLDLSKSATLQRRRSRRPSKVASLRSHLRTFLRSWLTSLPLGMRQRRLSQALSIRCSVKPPPSYLLLLAPLHLPRCQHCRCPYFAYCMQLSLWAISRSVRQDPLSMCIR